MKKFNDGAGIASFQLLAVITLFCILPVLLFADAPQWWADRGVTNGNDKNDYAAVNQGQLKAIAVAAYQELQNIPGGIGDTTSSDGTGTKLNALILSWGAFSSGTFVPSPGSSTNDYAAVNLGQVKTVVRPFYDRLLQAGYPQPLLASGTYPWVGGTANDYAIANIGQVKQVFNLIFLPASWQTTYFGATGVDPNADSDGDGLTNIQEYQQGLNPMQADNPAVQLNVNVIVK